MLLHNDSESPMIINDQLTQEETHRLITILEKHRSAFGYSLQDLKGISLALCTHGIPTDPNVLPSREPQRGLNIAMRDVLTVNSCIKVHLDLQVHKSPAVVKEPFFPRVVNPRYRIRGTIV
jgi:hypothetical protein